MLIVLFQKLFPHLCLSRDALSKFIFQPKNVKIEKQKKHFLEFKVLPSCNFLAQTDKKMPATCSSRRSWNAPDDTVGQQTEEQKYAVASYWCNTSSISNITALFTNMRIVKFNSQLIIAFFAAVNHLSGPLRKQNFTLTGSKGHGLWFLIGGFRSLLCISVFQGSFLVIVIMIDGSEKRNCEGGCLWKAQ